MIDCVDVGLPPLGNVVECQEAASSLGLTYKSAGSFGNNPKGCFKYASGSVYWNNHETGSKRSDSFVICKASGKYLLLY